MVGFGATRLRPWPPRRLWHQDVTARKHQWSETSFSDELGAVSAPGAGPSWPALPPPGPRHTPPGSALWKICIFHLKKPQICNIHIERLGLFPSPDTFKTSYDRLLLTYRPHTNTAVHLLPHILSFCEIKDEIGKWPSSVPASVTTAYLQQPYNQSGAVSLEQVIT